MGCKHFDYIIADKIVIPEHQKNYSEDIIYIENCYQPNVRQKNISQKNLKGKILDYQKMHLFIVALIQIIKLHQIYLIVG